MTEKIKENNKTFIDFDTINLWEIEDDEFEKLLLK